MIVNNELDALGLLLISMHEVLGYVERGEDCGWPPEEALADLVETLDTICVTDELTPAQQRFRLELLERINRHRKAN
jgi:hypothetical protein